MYSYTSLNFCGIYRKYIHGVEKNGTPIDFHEKMNGIKIKHHLELNI